MQVSLLSVLRGKFIALSVFIKKYKKLYKNTFQIKIHIEGIKK